MKGIFTKVAAVLTIVGILSMSGIAFAEDMTEDYGYLKGKANVYGEGGEQTFVYSEDVEHRQGKGRYFNVEGEQTSTSDATQADSDYSFRKGKVAHRGGIDKPHYDVETLVEGGVIDQATADAISEFMTKKHEDISAMYENKDEMTPDERHLMFEEKKVERKDGLEELVDAGIITEEQAEAIKGFTPEVQE